MSEDDPPCLFIVDCAALHEIASTRSNIVRSNCLDCLARGVIGVPACVWQEFKDAYEEEAAELESAVSLKLRMKRDYRIGAAAIAERLNSGFNPYDMKTDLYAASICTIEGHTLLTINSRLAAYKKMGCRAVVAITTWANNPPA
jgi:hypothetical protein